MRFRFIYGRSSPDRTIAIILMTRATTGLDDTCQSNAYRPVLYITRAFLNHSPRNAANAPAVFGLHGVLGITTCRR